MKWILSCAAMAAMILLAGNANATTARRRHVSKKAAAKKGVVRKKALGGTSVASAGKPVASSGARGKKVVGRRQASATTWRNRQTFPSPDRYREIQAALVAKGYLKPEEATGGWDANSVGALKKFQSEQNLESSGKINSLSLIALGLGPHHESTTSVAAPAPPSPQPETLPSR